MKQYTIYQVGRTDEIKGFVQLADDLVYDPEDVALTPITKINEDGFSEIIGWNIHPRTLTITEGNLI